MHVVVTAGHVDHGKSTLVRALTGTDPDRLPEEHRRGLTIELGYAWTTLPGTGEVAFVDVPGHERFVPTTLAGIGPVPVALLVVAADDPWMPQAAEHLAALDALEVSHAVVAVTRSDLADPRPAVARAGAEVARTSLAGAPVVPVSARAGAGLGELRAALIAVLDRIPGQDPDADVRLWVDRRFTVKGAGTVVTGTLPAGRVAAGRKLTHPGGTVRVRAVQSLGREVAEATGVARVALNVTGDVDGLERGTPLLTPGAWWQAGVVDVRLRAVRGAEHPPERPILHVGATAVAVHHRPLGEDGATWLARLSLDRPLPLRVGDRALLRDPGDRALWGVTVLDPAPPELRRRGAGGRRAAVLRGVDGRPDPAGEIARREVVTTSFLRRIGTPTTDPAAIGVLAGNVVVSPERADRAAADAERLVREHDGAAPLDPGVPTAALADRLCLPEPAVRALLRPPLQLRDGRVTSDQRATGLPERVEAALSALDADFAVAPFVAPTADRLRELGLDEPALAAAARAGRVLRPAPGVVLAADADQRALTELAALPQPFTTSEARAQLGTSRRAVLPLLDHLDRQRLTRRLPDDRREVRGPGG
ncbi:selenocysteine-specific translation elongation factor [Georgenia halophila]|uniref:Selenocysteine-specific translation elongation factor n=1 Tax=Georgenia halophila TaxID=620889 RepID=A0ABP8KWV1_9MICO